MFRDIAVMNKDGFITIVGRIKELIIRGGENVYPQEIENFLLKHESISEAHVCQGYFTRLEVNDSSP